MSDPSTLQLQPLSSSTEQPSETLPLPDFDKKSKTNGKKTGKSFASPFYTQHSLNHTTKIEVKTSSNTATPNISNTSATDTPNSVDSDNKWTIKPTFNLNVSQDDILQADTSYRKKLPPKELKVDPYHFEIAVQYLTDMIKIRPIQLRIQFKRKSKYSPLRAYIIMKSWIWSHLVYTAIWLHMLLALWEPPGKKYIPTWILPIQLIILIIYVFDIMLKFHSHDAKWIGKWTYAIIFVVLINILLVLIGFGLHMNKVYISIYSKYRIIRPFYLFYKSRDLKKLTKSILRGIPPLFEVGLLIVLFLTLFGFVAYYLLYESEIVGKNESFKTIWDSIYQLLVLQTTSNFPDVMMKSYEHSQYVAFFFFLFNVLGIYFLMALILAVIYNNYNDHIVTTVRKIKRTKDTCIKEAFNMLTYNQRHYHDISGRKSKVNVETPKKITADPKTFLQKIPTNRSSISGINKLEQPVNSGDLIIGSDDDVDEILNSVRSSISPEKEKIDDFDVKSNEYIPVIYYKTFEKLMERMRPDLGKSNKAVGNQIKYMYLSITNAKYGSQDDGISALQWKKIDKYIEIEVSKDISESKRISILNTQTQLNMKEKLGSFDENYGMTEDSVVSNNGENDSIFGIGLNRIISSDSQEKLHRFWLDMRLKLIFFWEWQREIFLDECCTKKSENHTDLENNNTNDIRARHSSVRRVTSRHKSFNHSIRDDFDEIIRFSDDDLLDSDSNNSTLRGSLYNNNFLCCNITSFTISTDLFVNLLVVLSVIILIVDISINKNKTGRKSVNILSLILILIFSCETSTKIIAWGWSGYIEDPFNRLDFGITVTALIFEVVLQQSIKAIVIFRIVRLMRLMRAFTRFRVILRTTKAVVQSFTALFILEFCLAYFYAIIGMESFKNLITESKVSNLCEKQNDENIQTTEFWCNIYSTQYYKNNFNTFSHAMVIQMELVVVNNWHVLTEMFTRTTNTKWTRLYFILVYFTTVVVVMNVLTAFVLEAFISQYQKSQEHKKKIREFKNKVLLQRKKGTQSYSNLNTQDEIEFDYLYYTKLLQSQYEDLNNELQSSMYEALRFFKEEKEVRLYHYNRQLTKAFFYEQLYPDLFKDNDEDEYEEELYSGRINVDAYNNRVSTNRNTSGGGSRRNSKILNNNNNKNGKNNSTIKKKDSKVRKKKNSETNIVMRYPLRRPMPIGNSNKAKKKNVRIVVKKDNKPRNKLTTISDTADDNDEILQHNKSLVHNIMQSFDNNGNTSNKITNEINEISNENENEENKNNQNNNKQNASEITPLVSDDTDRTNKTDPNTISMDLDTVNLGIDVVDEELSDDDITEKDINHNRIDTVVNTNSENNIIPKLDSMVSESLIDNSITSNDSLRNKTGKNGIPQTPSQSQSTVAVEYQVSNNNNTTTSRYNYGGRFGKIGNYGNNRYQFGKR